MRIRKLEKCKKVGKWSGPKAEGKPHFGDAAVAGGEDSGKTLRCSRWEPVKRVPGYRVTALTFCVLRFAVSYSKASVLCSKRWAWPAAWVAAAVFGAEKSATFVKLSTEQRPLLILSGVVADWQLISKPHPAAANPRNAGRCHSFTIKHRTQQLGSQSTTSDTRKNQQQKHTQGEAEASHLLFSLLCCASTQSLLF